MSKPKLTEQEWIRLTELRAMLNSGVKKVKEVRNAKVKNQLRLTNKSIRNKIDKLRREGRSNG